MPRKRRVARKRRRTGVEPWELAFARDELDDLHSLPEGANPFQVLELMYADETNEAARRELWERARDTVLPVWLRERPGTRPSLWWQFDAPEPALVSIVALMAADAQADHLEQHGLLTESEIGAGNEDQTEATTAC